MANYEITTKEGNCIFCEIAKGNIEQDRVFWQDDNFMAFLSLYPNTSGFAVVIPKKHYDSDCLALPDKVLQKFILASKKASNILLKYFSDVGRVGLIMEGTGINHAHIKLFPMHGTEDLKKGVWHQYPSYKSGYFKKYKGYIVSTGGSKANEKKLKELAEKLRKIQ